MDLVGLFDAAPDLSGNDVDVAPYVRDAEDLDAEVAWATWKPGENGAPGPEIRPPAAEYRCRDPHRRCPRSWRGTGRSGGSIAGRRRGPRSPSRRSLGPVRGRCCLSTPPTAVTTPDTGFDMAAPGPVPDSPELLTPAGLDGASRCPGRRAGGAGGRLDGRGARGRRRGRPTRPIPPASRLEGGSPSTSTAARSAIRPPRCSPPWRRPASPWTPPQRHRRRLPARCRQGARDLAGRDLCARRGCGEVRDRSRPSLG